MNKKFLSAIMCGAMLTASTSVFVSCEDYGDDIAHLQEQIDQNATTAASELAAKVAALESQLSTLKAAQDNMKEQLASAKAEAAAAANNALSAAQAAQAAADKAQSGAADAKAAADKAQAAADAASKGLSDAVTKVAVLEAKIASLETAIAELSASNKELNTKLNDLQNAYNLLNVNVNANAEEIKAIKADIAAKTADLAGQIAAVSSELAGKIDAIDARLKAVEATYAKVAELAALEAKLNEQIAANEAYVAAMEATIAELEAADAAAAALIAANHEEALAKIAAVNEELAAQKAEVAKNFEAVNAQIADLEATVATLAQLATANYNDIAALRQALDETATDLYDLVSQLAATDRALNEQVVAILEALLTLDGKVDANAADVEELISQLAATDRGFQTEFETIWGILDELNTASKDAAQQIVELIGADKGFAAQIEALLVDYTTNKELVAEQIINLSKADKDLKDDIVALMGDVKDLYEKLTSAVADLQAVDAKLAEQIKALFAQAEIFGKDIETLKEGIIALQKKDDQIVGMIKVVIADLAGVEKDAADNLAAAVAALEETIADNKELAEKALDNLEAALSKTITDNYNELTGKIAEAMTAIATVNTALDTKFTSEIANLQGQIDAIINGLHSVAFVPLYNGQTTYDIPVYYINTFVKNNKGEVVEGTNLYPTSTVKFRVEPAGYAAKLAAAFEENKDILKLESTDRVITNLGTRATAAIEVVEIKNAVADGDFLVLSVAAVDNLDGESKHVRPTTLVVSNDALSKTSDYFKLLVAYEKATAVNNEVVYAEGVPSHVDIVNNEVNALNIASEVNVNLYHNVFTAFDIVAGATELRNANSKYILPYDGASLPSDLQVVEVNDQAIGNGFVNEFFTVTKDGKISVNSTKDGLPAPGNLKKQIRVKVVDKAYQLTEGGADYVVYYYNFTIVENRCLLDIKNFDYAMEWPNTTAAEQELTVDMIKAQHAAKLAEYKVSAEEVFDAMYSAIGAGMVKEQNNVIVTLTAVTKDGKKHIYVSSKIANLATQNYNATNILLDDLFTFELDEVETTLTLGVNVALSIPSAGIDHFFEKILMYWTGKNNDALQVNYSLSETSNGKKYVYEVPMSKVYRSIATQTVNMNWSINNMKNAANEETTGFKGIAFVDGVLKVTGPIFAVYPSGDVKLNASDLEFTAEAYYGATSFGKHEHQLFNVVYPINNGQFENEISDMNFYYEDLKAGKPFEVVKGITLTDIDGRVWIKEGKIYDEVKTEWGINNLQYAITYVESAGQDLTSEKLFALEVVDGVRVLTINKQANITKDVHVTIKVSVDYTFATGIWDEYVVVIKPGKKPVEP